MEREEGNKIEDLRKMGLDRFSYPLYRDKVVGLYMHAYASGEYAQQIEQAEAEESLWTTIRYGFGQLAFDGQQLVVPFCNATGKAYRFSCIANIR